MEFASDFWRNDDCGYMLHNFEVTANARNIVA